MTPCSSLGWPDSVRCHWTRAGPCSHKAPYARRARACFSAVTHVLKFSIAAEQEAPHFHFAPGPRLRQPPALVGGADPGAEQDGKPGLQGWGIKILPTPSFCRGGNRGAGARGRRGGGGQEEAQRSLVKCKSKALHFHTRVLIAEVVPGDVMQAKAQCPLPAAQPRARGLPVVVQCRWAGIQ